MNILFSIIFYLIEFYIAFDIFSQLFEERFKRAYTLLTGLSVYTVAFLFFNLVENAYVNLIVFCIINFLYILFAFKSNVFKAILFSAYLMFLIMATEVLVIKGISSDLKGNLSIEENNMLYFATSFISKLLYFICGKLSLLFFSRNIISKSSDLFLLLLPAVSAVQYTIFVVLSVHYKFTVLYNCLLLICAVVNIIAIILTFIFYNKTTEEFKELYKAKNEADRVAADLAYYEILNEQNETLKSFIHDEKNHLLTIKSIADNDEVSRYIDSIYEDIKFHSIFGNTKNKYLDLLINKYNSICKTNGIYFQVNIHTANLSFMVPSDLITIISNILDNATEAAINSQEKVIVFSINTANGFDFIDCINSCDQKPNVTKDILQTLKPDKEKHGLGIKSIKQVTRKYKGEFNWSYNENKKEFRVCIAFKNKN
ncbi:MAG: GHKL domain-containing protein [Clostridia bacterium]|nr:GHKL domain-containing protein [Clostridia bacterium]